MIRTLLFLAAFFPATLAAAEPVRAIAMHGTPKYAASAKHLDYVNPDAPRRGTLTQSVAGTFDTLNPFTIQGKAAQGLEYVYDRLTARNWDEPFSLYGLIAKQIIVPDDRSSIEFILDERAKFQDGTPIRASDVKFSYEMLKNHGLPNMRRVYGLVSKVTIVNERDIKFDLKDGFDRETVMILAMMPVLPEHDWKDRNFNATTLKIPVGSGPYKIKSVAVGRKIEYVRNPDYWAWDNINRVGLLNFDRLVYDYYRDDAVALEAFKAHEVDIRREFDSSRWHTAYSDVSKDIKREALPHGRPEWVRGFIFNLRRPPFDDQRLREAVALAFDADFINRTLYRGEGKRITSIFPNTELSGAPTPAALDRRAAMKRADALLRESGWTVKGGTRMKDGRPLTFQILLANPADEKSALAFSEGLKKLGIRVNIRTVDAAQFAGALASYDYDMVLHYWINTLSPGTEQMVYWSCDAAHNPGSKNYSGVCDPAVDAAALAIASARDRRQLVESARDLDRRIMEKTLFVPLFTIGRDYWAYWNSLEHPAKEPLYGSVLESWWQR